MQKKLLAVAVAGALGGPAVAMAQSSTVQFFGTFYVEYGYNHQAPPSGQTFPFQDRQNVDYLGNPGSEIGFKGEEKLGGGLSAWFQCSATANFLDGGDGNGGDPDGLLCSRNSAIGLKGGFGNFYIGRWDNPYKRAAAPWRVGVNETGFWGVAFITHGGSTSTLAGTARSTFLRREGNSLFYDSPNFGGFQVNASFTTAQGPNGGTVGTVATPGITSSKPRTYSLGAQYSAGPLFVGAGYERHNEASANGGELDDYGWHIGAAYTWGPVRFGGGYSEQKHETGGGLAAPAAAGTTGGVIAGTGAHDAKYRAFHVGVDWRIVGPHSLLAGYTRAMDARGSATNIIAPGTTGGNAVTGFGGGYRPAPCVASAATAGAFAARSCNETGATMWQIRYQYTFSKRTTAGVGYARTDNDEFAGYTPNHLSAPTRGSDISTWGAFMRHTF